MTHCVEVGTIVLRVRKQINNLKDIEMNILTRADVQKLIENDSEFDHLTLDGLDLSGLDFTGVNLSYTSIKNCELRDTNFLETKLIQTKFTDSNLSGADFTGAQIWGSDFTDTILDAATVLYPEETECCDFDGATRDGNDFIESNGQ